MVEPPSRFRVDGGILLDDAQEILVEALKKGQEMLRRRDLTSSPLPLWCPD